MRREALRVETAGAPAETPATEAPAGEAATHEAAEEHGAGAAHGDASTEMQLMGLSVLVGLGGIGAEVARIAKGMGMEVIAWNRTPRPEAGVKQVLLDELLAKSDVISINLVLNDETRGFIGTAKIAAMKPGVILVNTARGALVDEAAMIAALQSGHLRHAALDVYNVEPLPAAVTLVKAQQPAIVFRQVGAGAVLYVGTDEMWPNRVTD